MKSVRTTCSYCGVGCGIVVHRDRSGRLTVEGDTENPVNRGKLCSKGRYLHHVAQNHRDRLLYPELRQRASAGGDDTAAATAAAAATTTRVTWDTALDHAAAQFQRIIAEHGPGAVALYVSGQLLTEEYYVANKLVKGFIGCNNIDTNSRLCMSSAVMGYKLALGDDLVPGSYDDVEQCDLFLIAGANPAWCHPILFRRLEAHKAAHPGVKVVVVDPRRTPTCDLADLHLQIQPGTDVTLFNAMARVLVDEGLIDKAFIADHTIGFDDLVVTLAGVSIDDAATICRVPRADIETAARWIGASPTFMSWWAMGLNQSSVGVGKNLALLNLSLLTGQIGKPGSGPLSLTGQPNAMGGREVGGMATLLAAHLELKNAEDRERVRAFWGGKPISGTPGLTAMEMVTALESGELKAIWIVCTNPSVSLPNLNRLEAAIRQAEFVVVQDISTRSDTVAWADLVLPAAGWLEKCGTMSNSERRITHLQSLVAPPGDALPDAEILCRFAAKMGWGAAFDYRDAEGHFDASRIFDEYARLTTGTPVDCSGVSHARLKREGSLQWPCPALPESLHPGTPRLFADHHFATPDGRARLHGVADGPLAGAASPAFPFIMTTGRIRDQWHTMTKTGMVARLNQHLDLPFVEIHPVDAGRLGIANGSPVRLVSQQGELVVAAKVTDTIKEGVCFVPMHWGKKLSGGRARVNLAVSDRVDPVSKQPDFKFEAVRLEPLPVPVRAIVIVGAGAAALAFVEAFRAQGRRDPITVIGDEALPFYNRVLLPELVSRHRDWQALVTADHDRMAELGVTHIRGERVTRLDRESRLVVTATGREVPYDELILATGSRPSVPRGIPVDLPGVMVLRRREDAERIRAQVRPGLPVLISGGGLLGLELAAALNAIGAEVMVLQRGDRLMRKQLDEEAADLLAGYLEEQGIQIRCNTQIADILQADGHLTGVRTDSGDVLTAALLCVAVGVTPNAELARAAGLAVEQGVTVDDTLQTSDPHVFAMGEVAQHRGVCYGTTPTATAQARVLASRFGGAVWSAYEGSTDSNILKVAGLELCSIGLTSIPPDAAPEDYDEIVLLDRRRRYYKKCIIHHDRLVGAILMGDKIEYGRFLDLIASGIELEERRDDLLRTGGGAAAEPVDGELICTCHNVGSGNLERHVAAGCKTFDSLCARSKAGTGCGSCRPEVRRFLEARLASATAGPTLTAAT